MREMLAEFISEESGVSSIEYGLLAAGIAVAMLASMSLLSCSLTSVFNNVSTKLKAV